MRAWQCDCGTYVDGPETRRPFRPQPSPGNVELEGELAGCHRCDPFCDYAPLHAKLEQLLERVEPHHGEPHVIERKAGT